MKKTVSLQIGPPVNFYITLKPALIIIQLKEEKKKATGQNRPEKSRKRKKRHETLTSLNRIKSAVIKWAGSSELMKCTHLKI